MHLVIGNKCNSTKKTSFDKNAANYYSPLLFKKTMRRKKHIYTDNAQIENAGDLGFDQNLQAPMMPLQVSVPIKSDSVQGLVRELLEEEKATGADVIHFLGRSGHSRVGLEAEIDRAEGYNLSARKLEFILNVSVLRSQYADRMLSVLQGLSASTREQLEIGRLLLTPEGSFLNKNEVENSLKEEKILLPENAILQEDGSVEISLNDFHWIFNDAGIMFPGQMRNVLLHGKHSLTGIQARAEKLPSILDPKTFFVGDINIALGGVNAVIRKSTNKQGVFHLAARLLHGVRTTGISIPRQIELYNSSELPIDFGDLKISLNFLPLSAKDSRLVVSEKLVKEGVSLNDALELEKNPQIFSSLMDEVTNVYDEFGNYGLFVAGGRAAKVPWKLNAGNTDAFSGTGRNRDFLNQYVEQLALAFSSKEPGYFLEGDGIPDGVRDLSERISLVGGSQEHGKLFASATLPEDAIMRALKRSGIGVFVCKNVNGSLEHHDVPSGSNKLSFSANSYEQLLAHEREGTLIYAVFGEMSDFYTPTERIKPHVREFYRGLWVKPEAKESLNKVENIVAMYGTHKDEVKPYLDEDMGKFMNLLSDIFGEKLAITHGKGPGVMQLADKHAEDRNIMRVGVGIDVEKIGQAPNFRPPAMVDFKDKDRLRRQKLMDDIATFKIFSLGGAGTLEEVAITLCSQKLRKNVITPIIFVDPFSNSDMDHLWYELVETIKKLAGGKQIPAGNASATIELLQDYVPNFCHLAKSYEEAAEIITGFVGDPISYYRKANIPMKHVKESLEFGEETHKDTRFPVPSWVKLRIEPEFKK